MTAPLQGWDQALELVEDGVVGGREVDVATLARLALTSEHHFRRVFSALAGMGLSDYVRRRRLTLAAAELLAGGGVLDVGVRHGWTSADAFSRAFRAHHGVLPSRVGRPGVVLRSQPRLTFHLTIGGADPVRHRIEHTDRFRIVGAHARLPLVHEGENTALVDFETGLPQDLDARLLPLVDVPALPSVLSVSSGFEDGRADGSDFDYHHGVATTRADGDLPLDLDVLEVPAAAWAVFGTDDGLDDDALRPALQQLWAVAFGQWFPANRYELAPGPEILAVRPSADGGELWLPVRHLPG